VAFGPLGAMAAPEPGPEGADGEPSQPSQPPPHEEPPQPTLPTSHLAPPTPEQPQSRRAREPLEDHHPDSLELALSGSLARLTTGSRRHRHSEELQRLTHEKTMQIQRRRAQQREAMKEATLRQEQESFQKLSASFNERNDRWLRKTEGSPFGADLLSEADRQEEKLRARERAERQQRLQAMKGAKQLRAAQLARALEPTEEDELARLRAEKRQLLEKEQHLRAKRDVQRKVREVTPLRSLTELARGVPPHLLGSCRTSSLPAL